LNIIEALDDEILLGASIKDHASFGPWKALLASVFGLPLDADQSDLYRRCTGRAATPSAPFRSVFMCIGRRGGKSVAMALMAVYLAIFRDWRPKLTAGERAVVLLVAVDRDQAKILYRYIVGILDAPIFNTLILNYTANSLDLKGCVTIEIVTRSFRAVRGRSVCAALLDECAFYRSEDDSANPDHAVVAAIRPSMATFGNDALLIAASSPYSKRGILWDAYKRYYGKDDADTLVWQAPTRTMNPTILQEFIDSEFERDPISASAEYGGNFRNDVDAFVLAEVVDDAVVRGRHELMPLPKSWKYHGFCDPSGGSQDSFTISIAHGEDDTAVLDCLREFRPMLNSGRVALLDNPKLIAQLCNLERRTARGTGRDIVDHPPNAHDDLINAAAGAICMANLGPVPLNFYAPIAGPGR
jgi:hypothetical protein